MIKCQICGREMKTLRKHLKVAHKMSIRSYSKFYPNEPTVDPVYAEKRRQIVLDTNTNDNLLPIVKGEKRALKNKEEIE